MTNLSLPPIRPRSVGCFAGIESAEYARRRRALCMAIGEDSLALVAARPNSPELFPPRQNSHFQYLTGVIEPGGMAIFAQAALKASSSSFASRARLSASVGKVRLWALNAPLICWGPTRPGRRIASRKSSPPLLKERFSC